MSAALQQDQFELVTRHFLADAPPLPTAPQVNVDEAIATIIDDFSLLEDWTERYQYIIDLGRKLSPLPDDWRTDAHKLHGCQSQVWLVTFMQDGALQLYAQSDSAIVNGLIALLRQVYHNRSPQDVAATDTAFLAQLGLNDHLSPTRRNGLYAMVNAIRSVAAFVEAHHG